MKHRPLKELAEGNRLEIWRRRNWREWSIGPKRTESPYKDVALISAPKMSR
jgi:hypothetical protein